MRKLPDILLIGLTLMFLIIGIDQIIVLGFEHGYWALMLALICFFGYTYRRNKAARNSPTPSRKARPRK